MNIVNEHGKEYCKYALCKKPCGESGEMYYQVGFEKPGHVPSLAGGNVGGIRARHTGRPRCPWAKACFLARKLIKLKTNAWFSKTGFLV